MDIGLYYSYPHSARSSPSKVREGESMHVTHCKQSKLASCSKMLIFCLYVSLGAVDTVIKLLYTCLNFT